MSQRPVSDDDAVALLRELVAIPSPSGGERAASEALVAWMAGHGLAARVDAAGNAVGVKGNGPRELLLLGHIDTFPGEVPVRRDGDRLYGRGAVDAKGALCAFAVAAARTAAPSEWRITVVGAVEEEAATSRGARHVLAERAPGSTWGPPALCVIGEPSRWDRVVLGYKGRLVMDLTLRAPFAHSAGADPLPAERAVGLWSAVERYCRDRNLAAGATREFDRLTPSLRAIATTDRGAYGEAHLAVGVRLPPGAEPGAVEGELVQTLMGQLFENQAEAQATSEDAVHEGMVRRHYRVAGRGDSGNGLQLTCLAYGHEPAFKAGKSNALVRPFLAAIREQGGDPRFVVKTGTSDMNLLGRHWPAVPVVAYGPGDSRLDHTPTEHVSLPEFLKAATVLEGAMRRAMGGGTRP